MKKGNIIRVQKYLSAMHPQLYTGKIDGIYGRGTRQAVKMFQVAHHLKPDGIAGRKTLYVMFGRETSNKRKHKAKSTTDNHVCKLLFPKETKKQNLLKEFYGDPRNIGSNMKMFRVPYTLYYGVKPVSHIYLNKKCGKQFQHFLENILNHYGEEAIQELGLDEYNGSYAKRKMRGANRWSTHSYGCSIDIGASANRLRWHRPKAKFSRSEYEGLKLAASRAGIYSLGFNHDYDYMHYQACWRK